MPILDNAADMEQHVIPGSNFGFSATKPDNLGASEYTLAYVVLDVSGSTDPFRDEMERVLKEVVKTMRLSPRADNLMLAVNIFADNVHEVHGLKLLENINESDYDGILQRNNLPKGIGGTTALRDATFNATEAIRIYSEQQLKANDFDSNAIVVVITDGCDNMSKISEKRVKESIQATIQSEALESIVTILIGVNVLDYGVTQALQSFNKNVGFTQYVDAGAADKKTLAKLAQFVSKSISAQSQSLGTGGPSQSLSF